MKLKFLTPPAPWSLALWLLVLLVTHPAQAQEEGVAVVLDEVIAQVNTDVVTLSMLKREMKNAKDALMQRGMTEAQATAEVEKNRARMIANLIDEQLVTQKGKEMARLTEDVEAEVNKEMLRVAKQQGIKSVEQLDEELRKAGLDPSDIRRTLRTQFMMQAVMQREVEAKIFFSLSNAELKKFFEEHREKFRKPEVVELSEIFLSLAGKPDAEVYAKALQIVLQARGGADFGQLAATHSEREQNGVRIAAQTKGKVGNIQVPELRDNLAAAIKNLPKGGISEPLRLDEGYQILRVDDRTGSTDPVFEEQHVRGAITQERAEKGRDDFRRKLRKEAYIQLAPDYQATVAPLLQTETPESASKQSTATTDTKKEKKP